MKPPIAIEKPCPLIQELFANGGGCSFCSQCGHHVHNLSEMTLLERESLMRDYEAGRRVCVAYRVTADGEMQTADPQPASASRLRRLAGMVLPFGLAACAANPPEKSTGQGSEAHKAGPSSGGETMLLGGVPPLPPPQ